MTTDVDMRHDLLDDYFARLNAMDLDGWLALLTEDVKVSMPFAPAGVPRLVEGKQAIGNVYRDLFAGWAALQVDVDEIQEGLDPHFATVRWHMHADLGGGRTYANDLIGTFRFRDDRICEVAEYFNPLNLLEAIQHT